MLRTTRWVTALAVVAVLGLSGTATPQGKGKGKAPKTKTFMISGSGTATHVPLDGSSVSHPSTGVATFLGAHQGQGDYRTVSFNPADLTFTFESAPTYTFTGANGDKLVCTYGKGPLGPGVGWAFPLNDGTPRVNAVFIAEFNPVGSACTGQFAGVTGSFLMLAWSTQPFIPALDAPFPGSMLYYSWVGEGKLTFPGNP